MAQIRATSKTTGRSVRVSLRGGGSHSALSGIDSAVDIKGKALAAGPKLLRQLRDRIRVCTADGVDRPTRPRSRPGTPCPRIYAVKMNGNEEMHFCGHYARWSAPANGLRCARAVAERGIGVDFTAACAAPGRF